MQSNKLINRVTELSRLDDAWEKAASGEAQLVMLWGRRRVGKTFLLSHFARRSRAVMFGATRQSEPVELARLHEAVRRDLGEQAGDLAAGGFQSWEGALRFFAAIAADEPLAVILDEVPYLTRSTPGFASVVQVVWDHIQPGAKLVLILTGSAVGTIERMLGAGGALRGRPTATMKLDPLDPVAARAFLPRLDAEPFIEAYAACGGFPLHLREWDERQSSAANLERLAGTTGGILLEDAEGILREELPESGGYSRILGAIGRGRTKPSQIAAEAGQRIEHPLSVLTDSGFVRRTLPVGAPRGARASYEIADPYLAFWFRVLHSDVPHIEAGQGPAVLRRKRAEWDRHLGWVFEELARDHARRLVAAGRLAEDLLIGRWWTHKGEPCEIDVLGLQGSRSALLGEARWQASPVGMRELEALRKKAGRAPKPIDEPTYVLWARGGVEPAVTQAGALGFDAEEMLAI